jgi:hypothetical protein
MWQSAFDAFHILHLYADISQPSSWSDPGTFNRITYAAWKIAGETITDSQGRTLLCKEAGKVSVEGNQALELGCANMEHAQYTLPKVLDYAAGCSACSARSGQRVSPGLQL